MRRLIAWLASESFAIRLRFIAGPPPSASELRVLAIMIVSVFGLLELVGYGQTSTGWFGERFAGDFPAFYAAGRILNQYPPDRLYDFALQGSIGRPGLVFVNGPWVALLFRPFAALPLSAAYLLWTAASVALYVAGLRLVHWRFGWPLALAFFPFACETIIGGQIACIAFFLFAAATRLLFRGKSVWAGILLAGCFYKPPLVVFPLLVAVFSRQVPFILGCLAGGTLLAVSSIAFVGPRSLLDWADALWTYQQHWANHQTAFTHWPKLIDLYHLLRGFLPLSVALPAFTAAAVSLAWRVAKTRNWPAAVALAPVITLHAMSYDAVLSCIAFATGDHQLRSDEVRRRAHMRLFAVLWVVAWCGYPVSRAIGIHPITLALLASAAVQLTPPFNVSALSESGHETSNPDRTACSGRLHF